jgi:hypothetical protein
VNLLFAMYKVLYGLFDKIIYTLDPKANEGRALPKWFMTILSTFGLGFQLLVIAVFLVLNLKAIILPFFLGYTAFILLFIGIRKKLN